jgi:hypothetical protein
MIAQTFLFIDCLGALGFPFSKDEAKVRNPRKQRSYAEKRVFTVSLGIVGGAEIQDF